MSDIKVGRLYLSNIHGLVKLNDVRHNGLSGEVAIIEDEQGRIHRPSVDFFLKNASICERVEADDTFNDDTPAQTFGQWEHETGRTCMCLGCKTVIPLNSPEFKAINKGAKCSVCPPNTGKMRLIGIAGPARAGKDTLASYLLDNLSDDWSRSSFADPLKDMLRAIGVDCSDDKKAVIDDSYGATPRHMMQTLGTEWGRQTIDNDIWVKAFARLNAGKCVIVPDVRFENEAELVRKHGVLIHLTGRGGIEGNHVSENAIEFKPGDIVIDNSRDLAWLHGQIDGNAVLGGFVQEAGE